MDNGGNGQMTNVMERLIATTDGDAARAEALAVRTGDANGRDDDWITGGQRQMTNGWTTHGRHDGRGRGGRLGHGERGSNGRRLD
ncbi:hypothetical protein BV898_19244 [Hypsibius exemplaris]|uniref:Uncharacterized protein n=1 Tax=Hypsibius exemplaris TaxID=2072580 RepID=A0A9X6NQC4_HYPEX|nr:hypothetical protein BV898_19244 [Hypsibius exemplaris]